MHPDYNRNKILLLIDDSPFDLKINTKIADHSGLFDEVLALSSGRAALAYLAESLSSPEKLPGLILLDIQMPEMNGFEFVEHYTQLPAWFREKCVLAILSSTDDENDMLWIEQNPEIVSLVRKPLSPLVLQQLMQFQK